MYGPKLRSIIIWTVIILLALMIGVPFVGFFALGAYTSHEAYVANRERQWVNPIKGETFQVDLDLDAEGRSYHITRAYKCSDAHVFTDGKNAVQRTVFSNQRIITQHLPSGHTVYIAVPDGCSYIWLQKIDHRPCAQLGQLGMSRHLVNCNGRFPVITNHIPFVLWTKDAKRPEELIGYINQSSFKSREAAVTSAIATITLRSGLIASPTDEGRWLRQPSSPADRNEKNTYFAKVYAANIQCAAPYLNRQVSDLRDGANVARYPDSCLIPLSRDGQRMTNLDGFLVFHKLERTIKYGEYLTPREIFIGVHLSTVQDGSDEHTGRRD